MRRFYKAMLLTAGGSVLFAVGTMFGVGLVTSPPERPAGASAQHVARADGAHRERAEFGASGEFPSVRPAGPRERERSAAAGTAPSGPDATASEAKSLASTRSVDPGQRLSSEGGVTVTAPDTSGSTASVAMNSGADQSAGDALVASPATAATPGPGAAKPVPITGAESQAEKEVGKSDVKVAVRQPPGQCNVAACSAAYKSFRASDCTFQPFEGPRELCISPPNAKAEAPPALRDRRREAANERESADVGNESAAARSDDDELRAAVEAVRELTEPPSGQGRPAPLAERDRETSRSACNATACARFYNSFDPSDCTFQPYEGPRQLCTR